MVDGDKTLKDHLEQIEATSGETPDALINPSELPTGLEHIWSWFIELSNARPAGLSGLEPISYPVIESWMRVTGSEPSSNDVSMIRKLDDLYRKLKNKKK